MSLFHVAASLKTRSDAESIDPSAIRLFISEVITAQYFTLAIATALVYNSIITLDKEIKYFWPNPRSSVSIIYFVNRYVGLLGAVCNIIYNDFTENLANCLFASWTRTLANLVTIILIDYILLIRVMALYNEDKSLSVVLKILLGIDASIGLGLLIHSNLIEGLTVGTLAKGMTVCGEIRPPPRTLSIISWSIPMAYGLTLLSLALYKAAKYWKLSTGFKGFHLIRILIRDQVLYYGFVIFCSVLQIINENLFGINPFLTDVLSAAASPTLLCILGGQLLINLKEAGERGVNGGTNYTPRSMSGIEFGENNAIDEGCTGEEGSA